MSSFNEIRLSPKMTQFLQTDVSKLSIESSIFGMGILFSVGAYFYYNRDVVDQQVEGQNHVPRDNNWIRTCDNIMLISTIAFFVFMFLIFLKSDVEAFYKLKDARNCLLLDGPSKESFRKFVEWKVEADPAFELHFKSLLSLIPIFKKAVGFRLSLI